MTNYHRIKYLNKIKEVLKNEKLLVLYWQRQVWKTTLMKILIKDEELKWIKKYFSFEDFQKRSFKSKQEFVDFLSFKLNIDFTKDWFLFLDEVQYVENIVGILKSIFDDENFKIKIIATGSWMWNIPVKAWSSLVWRWEEIFVYPFSFEEFLWIKWINTDFLNLEKYSEIIWDEIFDFYREYLIWWGYPEVIKAKTEEKKQKELQKIIKRFFEKDVNFWFAKDDFIEFEKIYFYLYQNVWNLLKIEKISDITWIWVKKIKKYLTFLKRSLVIFDVNPYFQNKTKEIFSQPNMYLSDLWIFSFLWKNFWDKIMDWKIIENFIFLELQKNFSNFEIKFYKKKNWTEIDFILENWDWKIIPIEVKSNDNLTIPKIFYSFKKDFDEKINFFVRTTKKNLSEKKVEDKKILFVPNFLVWYINLKKIN